MVSCKGRRAARISSVTSASSRSTSSTSAAAPCPSASSRRAVSGVRSRWDRSATRSRSAVSSSSIRSASRLRDSATAAISGGPATTARAAVSPPARSRLVRARSAAGRVTLRARRSVTATDAAIRRRATPASTAHASVTPSVMSAAGTRARSTTTSSVLITTGVNTSTPSSVVCEKACCRSRAKATASWLAGVVSPIRVPSGSRTLIRPSCPGTLAMAVSMAAGSVLDGQGRGQRSQALLSLGDGAVASDLADQHGEREGERGHQDRGDREGDEEEPAAHGRLPA